MGYGYPITHPDPIRTNYIGSVPDGLAVHGLGSSSCGSKGPTHDQLLSFLRSNSTDDLNSFASQLVSVVLSDATPSGGSRLSFVDGVWLDQSLSLHPSFRQLVSNNYKTVLASIDFQMKVKFSTFHTSF
ncbi:hypothetical protein PIB30_050498 [Stylosanthes scabra]|uniref:Serpin domain-containing protein n=1 Tax=Stylosanthes scabra TaxID=79078 RepID=A0ABU6QI63_9FABA|nr:hypothetical protein [Stylosanthes scabra]